jgi:hypothetical protein
MSKNSASNSHGVIYITSKTLRGAKNEASRVFKKYGERIRLTYNGKTYVNESHSQTGKFGTWN